MPTTRRRLLEVALLVPAAAAFGAAATTVLRAAERATIAVRPSASGTSATRCATCGAPGHTMLDAACPNAPRVL